MRIDNERTPATKSDFFLLIGLLKGPALFFGAFCLLVFLTAMFPRERESEIELRPKIEPRKSVVSKVSEPQAPVKQAVVPRERAARSLQYGIDIEAANEIIGTEGHLRASMSGNSQKLESYSWVLPNGKTLLGKFKNGLLDDWSLQDPPPPPPTEKERAQQIYLQELEAKYSYMMQKAQNLNVVKSIGVSGSLIKVVVGNGFYQLPFQGKKDLAKLISQFHIENGNSALGTVVFYDLYNNDVVGEFYGGLQGKFL